MRTVKELAAEYNVSVQTIYRRLTELDQNGKQPVKVLRNGKSYITPYGEVLISKTFPSVNQMDSNVKDNVKGLEKENSYEKVLLERISYLETELSKQLEINTKNTERIHELSKDIAELARNNQILLGAEQSRTNPVLLTRAAEPEKESAEPKKRRGFFDIFRSN